MAFLKSKRILFVLIPLLLIIAASVTFLFTCQRKQDLSYEERVIAFGEENEGLKEGQIVFLGDSITAGYDLDRYYSDLPLEVYNRGISGDTTDWLMTRMAVSLFDISPSKVVLMIGTNDVNLGRSDEEIAENYRIILDMIGENLPDAEVFCVSVIPQGKKFSDKASENNLTINKTNERIKALAEQRGYTYVDLYTKLADENQLLKNKYTTDGLHLGFRGYKVWTKEMKSLLDK